MYIRHIEDIVVSALDEWASMDRPIELLSGTRKVAFKVITDIFLGSSSGSVLDLAEKLYVDVTHGLISAAINIPGFAFHKALKVMLYFNTKENGVVLFFFSFLNWIFLKGFILVHMVSMQLWTLKLFS